MKATTIPALPNSTRLLVDGYAHLDGDGTPECGADSNGAKPMSLAQALVWVRPLWCPRCFGPWMGGRR